MKNLSRIVIMLLISLFFGFELSAQCVPDTANCKDENDPGEFCPRKLPDAVINVAYDEVITVIPPGSAVVNDIPINIMYIVVDSVLNLPPGISVEANADRFYPDSAFCISINGTPTEAGDFQLAIYVTPFIKLVSDTIPGPQVVDDTSVVMTVLDPSSIDPYNVSEFRVMPTVPNPFSEVTRLGFFTPFDDRVELKVFSILGEMMHQELMGAPPGEHFFEFNGSELLPGTYFYRVTSRTGHNTGKFIKTR